MIRYYKAPGRGTSYQVWFSGLRPSDGNTKEVTQFPALKDARKAAIGWVKGGGHAAVIFKPVEYVRGQ